MSQTLTTSQGDLIAFEAHGTGPPLVFITGAGSYRANDPTFPETAELVATHGVSTVVYDRIGFGESTGYAPITLAREIAVLHAVLDQVGGSAVLCGHSSGAAIALNAATTGLPVTGLALWEVPVIGTAEQARIWATEFIALLDAEDHTGAIEYFTKDLPPDYKADLKTSPMWQTMVDNAQSLRADAEALAWFHSAPLSTLLGGLTIPVLTMVGNISFDEMHRAADAITEALPQAQKRVMPGAQHEWSVQPMAQELADFVKAVQRTAS